MTPTIVEQSQAGSAVPSQHRQSINGSEYDPCVNANLGSPFYLYKHDSPRPSTDGAKFKTAIIVSEHDLELGDSISPTITLEKQQTNKTTKSNKSRFTLWKRQSLRITPKQKGRIARLPKKQRMMVKGLIAFLVIGCMIGIAVGIAAGLKSGVWKSNNQQAKIGSA